MIADAEGDYSYLKLITDYFRPQYLTLSVWSMNVRHLPTAKTASAV